MEIHVLVNLFTSFHTFYAHYVYTSKIRTHTETGFAPKHARVSSSVSLLSTFHSLNKVDNYCP